MQRVKTIVRQFVIIFELWRQEILLYFIASQRCHNFQSHERRVTKADKFSAIRMRV